MPLLVLHLILFIALSVPSQRSVSLDPPDELFGSPLPNELLRSMTMVSESYYFPIPVSIGLKIRKFIEKRTLV